MEANRRRSNEEGQRSRSTSTRHQLLGTGSRIKQKAYNNLVLRQLARSASVNSNHGRDSQRSNSGKRLPRPREAGDSITGAGKINKYSSNRKRLINVGNIQVDEHDLKRRMHRNMMSQLAPPVAGGPAIRQHGSTSAKNIAIAGANVQTSQLHGQSGLQTAHNSSLNYINRRNEQSKQIEENIQMLKRIHFARPTINYLQQQKHAEKTEQLKHRIQHGGNRYAMVQAARDVILQAESGTVGKRMREKMVGVGGVKNKNRAQMFGGQHPLRVSSSSGLRKSSKTSGSRYKDMYRGAYLTQPGTVASSGQGHPLTSAMKSFHM